LAGGMLPAIAVAAAARASAAWGLRLMT